MLIRDWMTKDVITAGPDTSMMKASKLLKDNNIRRLPVVDDEERLVGIVSDRDIKEASPSKATTLDVHELYYLLSEIKLKDIMTKDPASVSPTDTVEAVALKLLERRIGGVPVVDGEGKVVGIITDMDLFQVLVSITGVRHGGVQFAFELDNTPGSLKQVLDDLVSLGARIVSVLTSMENMDTSDRQVVVRIMPMDRSQENAVIEAMQAKHNLCYWARDSVHPRD